jgi:sugar phosphate isomerase/epimerase
MNEKDRFYSVEEIRQRLSIHTMVFWQHRPVGEGALEEVARCGIRKIELMESPEQFDMSDMRSMRLIGEACRSSGIEVVAYHASMTGVDEVHTEAERSARVDLCRRQIDTMLDLGGVLWGVHTGIASLATDATAVRCYEELALHVEGTGAAIAIENFDRCEGEGVEDRMAFLDTIDHPQVGLLLDVGHAPLRRTWGGDGVNPMTVPGGPTRVLETCGRRLRHVHLQGSKDGVDHFPPFAEGDSIQWVELFRMLRAVGYSGDFNFEPMGEPRHQNALEEVALAPERIVELEAQTP